MSVWRALRRPWRSPPWLRSSSATRTKSRRCESTCIASLDRRAFPGRSLPSRKSGQRPASSGLRARSRTAGVSARRPCHHPRHLTHADARWRPPKRRVADITSTLPVVKAPHAGRCPGKRSRGVAWRSLRGWREPWRSAAARSGTSSAPSRARWAPLPSECKASRTPLKPAWRSSPRTSSKPSPLPTLPRASKR